MPPTVLFFDLQLVKRDSFHLGPNHVPSFLKELSPGACYKTPPFNLLYLKSGKENFIDFMKVDELSQPVHHQGVEIFKGQGNRSLYLLSDPRGIGDHRLGSNDGCRRQAVSRR